MIRERIKAKTIIIKIIISGLFLLLSCNKFKDNPSISNPSYIRILYDPLGPNPFWLVYLDYPTNVIPKDGEEYKKIGIISYFDYPLVDQYQGHYVNTEDQQNGTINNSYKYPGPVINNMDFYKWHQISNGLHRFSFYKTGSDLLPNAIKPDSLLTYNFKPNEFYTIYILYDYDYTTFFYTYYIKIIHEGFKNQDFSDEKKGRIRFLNLDHINRNDFDYDVYFQYYTIDKISNSIIYKGNEKFMQNFNSKIIDSADNVPFAYYDIPDSILNNPIGHEPSTCSLIFKFYLKGQSAATMSQPQQLLATNPAINNSVPGPGKSDRFPYFPNFLISSGNNQKGTARTIINIGVYNDFSEFVGYSVEPNNANDGYFDK